MRYLLRLILVMSVGLGLQQQAKAQKVTVDSIRLARLGGLYLPSVQRALMFSLEPQSSKTTRLRHYVFDPALQRRHRRDLYLPGSLQMVNAASSRYHSLYQLRRRGTDSILTVVVDTTGQLVARQSVRQRMLPWRELHGAMAPLSEGFLLEEPSRKHEQVLVRYLAPDLQSRWTHRFTAATGRVAIEQVVMDSTHVWLVVTTNVQSRLAESKAYCLELATGRVLCRQAVDYQQERRVPSVASMGPGHSLLLAGYSYDNNRPSRTKTGQLFYTRFNPDSTRQADQRVLLSQDARLFTAQGRKVLWQGLMPDAAGNVRLVGETYTSTSLGGHIAIGVATGILTLGTLQVSTTTLRPRDIVSLKMTAAGKVEEVRVLPLPDGGSYTVGGYVPARRMAILAAQAGTFRLRGFAPDSNRVILRSERRILTFNTQSGQSVTVQETPASGYFDVWHTEPSQLLLYHEQRMPQRVTLQQIAY